MARRMTKDEFIKKAKEIHGDLYDYSLVIYKRSKSKVKIICRSHGEFEQIPYAHLQGQGCMKCSTTNSYDTNGFIKKAKEIHGDLYDYSLVEYTNNKAKVKIICKEHGIFSTKPNVHLLGSKCSKCSKKYNYSTEEFIEKAREVHGDKYDYSLVEYKNNKDNVKIICPMHGVFKQNLINHIINGHNCTLCRESSNEAKIHMLLDDMDINFLREYRFNDCRDIRPLPFDFYLEQYNMCIEYDGLQHFKAIDFFGGVEAFNSRVKKDKIKDNYCRSNNIKLLRLSGNDNIKEVLYNTFNNGGKYGHGTRQ